MQGRRGEEPRTPNAGENALPESKRLKDGPGYHITLRFLPDGDTRHLRRSTLNPKDTTDRVRFRWQALAPGKCRCTSRDLTSPAAALKSWYDKYHILFTEECRVELHQDIRKRTDVEARGTPRASLVSRIC